MNTRISRLFGLSLLFLSCSVGKNKDILSTNHIDKFQQIIAHRGGAKLAPENTLAAFRQAIDLGVDMIEIDVILSKDGEIIVIHDDTVDRTSNGIGTVKEMTLAEIRQYDAGSWFDEKFQGELIPTLDEVFETINGKAILLIEIKDGDEEYPGLEKKVVEAIHKYKARDWVIVQSFNEQSVLRVKKMDASLITYYLLGRNFTDFYATLEKPSGSASLPYDGLAVHHSVIDASKAATIRNAGYGLFVWTVNESEDMERIVKIGLNGIITDLPDQLQILLKNSKK
jgi:glycerophosphoryl diester phosphodiesterase